MLAVPSNQTVVFERFSDSAGAYIKLDSNNPSVYKQLYRAAKAKLKLRIRATISTNPMPVPSVAPTAIPVPDPLTAQPYASSMGANRFSADALQSLNTLTGLGPTTQPTETAILPSNEQQHQTYTHSPPTSAKIVEPFSTEAALKKLLVATEKLNAHSDAVDFDLKKAYGAVGKADSKEDVDEAPVPRLFPARDRFYAELASMSSKDNQSMFSIATPNFTAPGTSFTICCNICNDAIPNTHYHCSKCDDGDFDICEACYGQQIRCDGDDHWLVRRYVKDGKVTPSLTETIAPKKHAANETKEIPGAFNTETVSDFMDTSRTCNSCVGGKSRESHDYCL